MSNISRHFLSAIIVGAFIFSDFYFFGVGRVMDYLLLFGIFLLMIFRFSVLKAKVSHDSLILISIIFPWLILGIVQGSYLLVGAMVCGILIVYSFFRTIVFFNKNLVEQSLVLAIKINLVFLAIQILFKFVFDIYIDFHAWVGSIESRGWNEDLHFFRPSGLFQEPNAYCVCMFCLVSARALSFSRADILQVAGIFSMVLTQSLWGFGGAFVLSSLIFGWYRTLKILFLGVLLVFLIGYLGGISLEALANNSTTIFRLLNIDQDPSRLARFGDSSVVVSNDNVIFGNGVSSDKFQSTAVNSFAFIFYSFGLVGLSFLMAWGIFVAKINMRQLIAIGFLFTASPLFAYMFFWIWLAFVFSINPKK